MPIISQELMHFEHAFSDLMGNIGTLESEQNHAPNIKIPLFMLSNLSADIIGGAEALIQSGLKEELKGYKKNADLLVDALPKGNVEEDNFVLPHDILSEINGTYLNVMANMLHVAAKKMIKTKGEIGSCDVSDFEPDAINAVTKYCLGTGKSGSPVVEIVPLKKFKIGEKTYIENWKTKITQSLGVHSVMPSFMTTKEKTGEETKVAVEYHDSYLNHEGSANRLRGVRERLELLGFDCTLGKSENGQYKSQKIIYCNADDVPVETIKTMGTFFTMLKDGDIGTLQNKANQTKWGSYKVIRDTVWDKAIELNKKYGDEAYKHAPNGLNWGQAYKEWEEASSFKNNPIYNDVRDLLILRDRHHMIEEEFKIGNSTAPTPVACIKKILENTEKIQALAKKNNWSSLYFSHQIAELKSYVAAGKPHPIGGTGNISDGIGNHTHGFIISKLHEAQKYGGCTMQGFGSNINAGNLAYCEGILEGTSGIAAGSSGNEWAHDISPETIKAYVGEDDFPDYEYRFRVSLPNEPLLKADVKKYLATMGLDCKDNYCLTGTKNLDTIRNVAVFMSNLKGLEKKVGQECIIKSLADASKTAKSQSEKGIFSFTQTPLHATPKEWIDVCYKKYGIAPPDMTPEQKKIVALLGQKHQYGGCIFEESDVIPNMGYIRYCEGVRQNPQADLNGYYNQDGSLTHYYHLKSSSGGNGGAPDQVATITITPLPGNKNFAVNIANLDLREGAGSKPLQHAVVDRLKNDMGFQGFSGLTTGKAEKLSENEVRLLAAYLSSFHKAWDVKDDCKPKAEKYVWGVVNKLPDDIKAAGAMVYPFEIGQWNKDVCPPGAKIDELKPKKPEPEKIIEPEPEPTDELKSAGDFVQPIINMLLTGEKEGEYLYGNLPNTPDKSHKWISAMKALITQGIIHADVQNLMLVHTKYKLTPKGLEDFGEKPTPETKSTGIIPVTKYSYELVKEIAHGKLELSGCDVSSPSIKPSFAKAAYCAGIPKYVQSGVPTQAFAHLTAGFNQHYIIGIDNPVIFDSAASILYITLPVELQHPLVQKILVKILGYKQDPSNPEIFSRNVGGYLIAAFRASLFLSQLTAFDKLDEACKVKAVEKAKAVMLTGQHDILSPISLEGWKDYCEIEPEKTDKKKSFPTIYNQVKELFENSPTMALSIKFLKNQFGAENEDIVLDVMQKLYEEGLIKHVEGTQGDNAQYILNSEKSPPDGPSLTNFIKNIFVSNPNEIYNLSQITDMTLKKYATSPGWVQNSIHSLVEEGIILELPNGDFYTFNSKTSGVQEAEWGPKVIELLKDHIHHKMEFIALAEKMHSKYGVTAALTLDILNELIASGQVKDVGATVYIWVAPPPALLLTGEIESIKTSVKYMVDHDKNLYDDPALFVALLPSKLQANAVIGEWMKNIYENALAESKSSNLIYSKSFNDLSVGDYGAIQKHVSEAIEKGEFWMTPNWVSQQYEIDPKDETMLKFLNDVKKAIDEIKNKDVTPAIDFHKLAKDKEKIVLELAKEFNNKPKEWKEKTEKTDAYKKLPNLAKDWVHAFMAYNLAEDAAKDIPYEKTLEKVKTAVLMQLPHLTPLMVKLQLDLEKKALINKGELPECDNTGCQVKASSVEEMSGQEQQALLDDVQILVSEGKGSLGILASIPAKYGIKVTPLLESLVGAAVAGYKAGKGEDQSDEEDKMVWSKLDEKTKNEFQQAVKDEILQKKGPGGVYHDLLGKFGFKQEPEMLIQIENWAYETVDLWLLNQAIGHQWGTITPEMTIEKFPWLAGETTFPAHFEQEVKTLPNKPESEPEPTSKLSSKNYAYLSSDEKTVVEAFIKGSFQLGTITTADEMLVALKNTFGLTDTSMLIGKVNTIKKNTPIDMNYLKQLLLDIITNQEISDFTKLMEHVNTLKPGITESDVLSAIAFLVQEGKWDYDETKKKYISKNPEAVTIHDLEMNEPEVYNDVCKSVLEKYQKGESIHDIAEEISDQYAIKNNILLDDFIQAQTKEELPSDLIEKTEIFKDLIVAYLELHGVTHPGAIKAGIELEDDDKLYFNLAIDKLLKADIIKDDADGYYLASKEDEIVNGAEDKEASLSDFQKKMLDKMKEIPGEFFTPSELSKNKMAESALDEMVKMGLIKISPAGGAYVYYDKTDETMVNDEGAPEKPATIAELKAAIVSYLKEHGATEGSEIVDGIAIIGNMDDYFHALKELTEIDGTVEYGDDGYIFVGEKNDEGAEASKVEDAVETIFENNKSAWMDVDKVLEVIDANPKDFFFMPTYQQIEEAISNLTTQGKLTTQSGLMWKWAESKEDEPEPIPTLSFNAQKELILTIINGAADDFDWSIENITNEWQDHSDAFTPSEEAIEMMLKQLAGEGCIDYDVPEGVIHSKMTIVTHDTVSYLVSKAVQAGVLDILNQGKCLKDVTFANMAQGGQLGNQILPYVPTLDEISNILEALAEQGIVTYHKDGDCYQIEKSDGEDKYKKTNSGYTDFGLLTFFEKHKKKAGYTATEIQDILHGTDVISMGEHLMKLAADHKIQVKDNKKGTHYFSAIIEADDSGIPQLKKLFKEMMQSGLNYSSPTLQDIAIGWGYSEEEAIQAIDELADNNEIQSSTDEDGVTIFKTVDAKPKKKPAKKPVSEVDPALKEAILKYLATTQGMQKDTDITNNILYVVGGVKIPPSPAAVKVALGELTQAGELIWSIFEDKYQLNAENKPAPASKKEFGNWWFTITSKEYGVEEYGPYNTKEDAEYGKASVIKKALELDDGIDREYSDVFEKNAGEPQKLPHLKQFGYLSKKEKDGIKLYITSYCTTTIDDCLTAVEDQFGLIGDPNLVEFVEAVKLGKVINDLVEDENAPVQPDVSEVKENILKHLEANYQNENEFEKTFTDSDTLLQWVQESYPGCDAPTLDGALYQLLEEKKLEYASGLGWRFKMFEDYSLLPKDKKQELKEAAKKPLKDFSLLKPGEIFPIITFIWKQADAGKNVGDIIDLVTEEWGLHGSALLKKFVTDEFEHYKTQQAQKNVISIPEPKKDDADKTIQDAMQSFLKMGMSPEAVVDLYEGTFYNTKLKEIAKKAVKNHVQPDKVFENDFDNLDHWVQTKIKYIAHSMLVSGSNKEATADYITKNFNITQESFAPVIKALRGKAVTEIQDLIDAFKLLGIGNVMGGCDIVDKTSEIKGSSISYCQGIAKPSPSPDYEQPKAEVSDKGKKVSHITLAQTIELITGDEKLPKSDLNYKIVPEGMYKQTTKNVERILGEFRFNCEKKADNELACIYQLPDDGSMSIMDQANIRKAALFLSSIDKIPKLSDSCIEPALEYAKNHAVAVSKTAKPWDMKIFPYSVLDWSQIVCSKIPKIKKK